MRDHRHCDHGGLLQTALFQAIKTYRFACLVIADFGKRGWRDVTILHNCSKSEKEWIGMGQRNEALSVRWRCVGRVVLP